MLRSNLIRNILLACGVTAVVAREAVRKARARKMLDSLQRFTPIPELDSFVEALPRLHPGAPRWKHSVLLLHGYSASPYEFGQLMKALERAGIPYYAPVLTGHGLNDLHLMYSVKPGDWLRDAVIAYDHLAALAEEVSVVGHSTGATLAVYVAEHRPVKHLVLSGPNLIPGSADRRYKRLLNIGRLAILGAWLVPLVAKPIRPGRVTWTDTRDPAAARRGLSYATVPLLSLKAQWALQDRVDLARAAYKTLTIAHGAQDLTVDVDALLRRLGTQGIAYTRLSFANSGHNILQDYDKHAAVRAIVDALQQ